MSTVRTSVIALALLLVGCVASDRRPTTYATASHTRGTLKLAEWNMEFLAAKTQEGCNPRGDADYAAMKRTIDAIDADVFAFEEVENEAAAARVFDPAIYIIVMEKRVGHPGGSCGGEHPHSTFIRQAVGFAVRKGLVFQRGGDLTALQLGNPNLRSGVEIVVHPAGGEPLRLLAVHLKSGCFQGELGRACPEILRQMPIVKAWVQAANREGTRFAIMGDWNRRLALSDDVFWREIDNKPSSDAGLVLSDAGIAPHCDPHYHDFIDHIVLDRRAGAQASGFFETTFRGGQRLSDHCPLSINIKR